MDCEACAHNSEHGWWGPTVGKGTHCRGCHRTWRFGSHCYGCHQHFASASGFDAHQRTGGCIHLGQLKYKCQASRFKLVEQSGGLTWRGTLHPEVCKNWGLCGVNGRSAPGRAKVQ